MCVGAPLRRVIRMSEPIKMSTTPSPATRGRLNPAVLAVYNAQLNHSAAGAAEHQVLMLMQLARLCLCVFVRVRVYERVFRDPFVAMDFFRIFQR